MDFNLSTEHKLLKKRVYESAVKNFGPVAEEIDRKDKFPPDVFKKLGELGILGVTIPKKYGGAEADYLSAVIIIEELARVCPAIALSYGAHSNLCTDNLYRNGTEEQRMKYLPPLCTGEKIGALGLTEPGAGSDAVSIQTTATKVDDEYILNGTKTLITNGPIADIILLYAKTDSSKGGRGISAFIVEKDFPGFSVSKAFEKMGHRGSPTGELILDDCRIPKSNLVGRENMGINVMMSGLDIERAVLSGGSLGIAQAAMDLSIQYAKEHIQFGRCIGESQWIQEKLADMYTHIESARLLTYKAAMSAENIEHGGKGTEIHKLAAAALLFGAEVAMKVTLDAVQIHGYTSELPVNRLMRDAKLLGIGAGTSEIRRLIIARELLK